MKISLTSTIAVALIASAGFAGIAAAQDYDMTTAPLRQGDAPNLDDTSVDRMSTGSIVAPTASSINNTGADTDIDNSQDDGDYYNGVSRPQ
jgi:hypothetical protein